MDGAASHIYIYVVVRYTAPVHRPYLPEQYVV